MIFANKHPYNVGLLQAFEILRSSVLTALVPTCHRILQHQTQGQQHKTSGVFLMSNIHFYSQPLTIF